jgi:hypothetical protein
MSKDEQDLIRIRVWDAYQPAKQLYLAQRHKLVALGKAFSEIAEALESPSALIDKEPPPFPSRDECQRVLSEYRMAVRGLKSAWAAAKEMGWPVDPKDVDGLGPLMTIAI